MDNNDNMQQQYQITKLGGPLALASAPKPTPGADEISIRIKAVALNPLDYKMLTRGDMVQSWPSTFGLDAAGVVEEVGSQVSAFSPGDEVFALCGIGGKAAAFQDVATVKQCCVAKKPASCSFEEVASLPICYLTAASAILFGIRVPIPHISPTPPTPGGDSERQQQHRLPRSVLVLGGASAVGSAAIQLLKSAAPDAVILTTASPKHVDRLEALGATKVIDRHSTSVLDEVLGAASGGVDAIIDCLTAAAEDGSVFDALSIDGPRAYVQVFTGEQVQVPSDVNATVVFGRQVFGAPGGLNALSQLSQELDQGRYKLPVPVEVIGKGWEAIGKGLETYQNGGVSGHKLIVTV